MNKTFNWKPFSVLAASLLLAACGGGGGGSSDAAPAAPGGNPATPVSPPPTPSTPATTITGAVTKGPVSGATLQLFEMDAFGNPIGTALATGQSEADGTFTIPLDLITPTSDLLIVASGGSFIDESDQNPDIAQKRQITLGANDTFLSVVPLGSDAVALTPFTTALVLRGRVLGGPDGTFAEKFAAARTAFSTQAGFDVLTTIPANPIAPAADASAAQLQYALLLGGIANLINNVAIQSGAAAPTYDMVVAVTFDLVDGVFDGQYFGQTDVPGSGQTPVTLPQNINFTNEVNRFRNNNAASFDQTLALPTIEVPTLANGLPTANAGVDQSVAQAQAAPVQLDGSASADPDSGLFFSWVQTAGTTVTLDNGAIVNPSFTAPARLIGNETLTFELTVIDTVGFTSVDTVNVEVVGALSNDFYVVDEGELGPGVGIDVDGGGRITLTDGTNGILKSDIGPTPFTYTVAGNVLTVEFLTPFLQDDFDEERDPDLDGVFDLLLVEEFAERFIFTLVTDNPNADALTIETQGFELVKPLDDPAAAPLANTPLNDVDPITAFDVAQAVPFANLAGTRRTLMFNSGDVLTTLTQPVQGGPETIDELFPEIFEFADATSGSTRDSNMPFTYTIASDGSLNVVFQNNDTAKYINLGPRATGTGDLVATEYVLDTPFFPDESPEVTDVTLSFLENTAVAKPTTRAEVAGVYTGLFFFDAIDGGSNINLKLNPDGSGSVTLDQRASVSSLFDFDDLVPLRSSLGICWDVDPSNGDITINRALSFNAAFPGSFSAETDPTFCSTVIEENTEFQFVFTQLDSDGTTYKFFNRFSDNRCQFIPTPNCAESPVLDPVFLELRINTREPLSANPPVAALDSVQTPDATPISIDVAANDIPRDNPINAASVTIVAGPFQGTANLDVTTGIIDYTPNPGIRGDLIAYTVADNQGNRSQIQTAQIVINPCPLVNGVQPIFDAFTGDCIYDGTVVGATNPVLLDLNLGPLPDGGVHRFQDSLLIGDDFSTDAGLAAAGIAQGGDGPSLNIAAGTVLAFENASTALTVRRGSQINVGGTPTEPVIMTSFTDIQSKRAVEQGQPGSQVYNDTQQWGGLEILGFGVVNQCTYTGSVATADLALSGECHLLAPSGQGNFGGNNNLDNSGAISYLQVRYAGAFLGSDNLGAIAFGGVGSGTSISDIQVYSTGADGFQLGGGAVSLQNVISLYAKQAGILTTLGYSGGVNSALIIQDQVSGEFCVDTEGADDEAFTPAQIDGLITQGINSRPTYTNMTCVVSSEGFDTFPGVGFDFISGAHGTLVDSIAFVPGVDRFTNYCVDVNDQSLDAVDNGFLTISSNLFACPSTTPNILPSMIPLQSFLTSSGNQFASLSPGTSNPPPVTAAGTGNVLVEGSPLIYTAAPASLQLDGSPVVTSPNGTFFGAVQQGASDWTQGWTFGLHPGLRLVPLWYEGPIIDTPRFLPVSKGATVTLDASQTVSAAGGLTFQWTQLDAGPSVGFTAPSSPTTLISAPGAGTNLTQAGGFFNLELVVTDASGAEARRQIDVDVQASIPEDFFAATEFIIPFQFNRDVGGGPRIQINLADNTGTYINSAGSTPFIWSDSPTDFTMDFTGSGGLVVGPSTSFEDVNMDAVQEEIQRTTVTDSIVFTLVSDNGPKKLFSQTSTGVESIFDVTNGVALPDDPFVSELDQNSQKAVVSVNNGLFVEMEGGETIIALTDAAANFPFLFNPNTLVQDKLSFNGDGTGFADQKNTSFNWFVDNTAGSRLIVNFADGDVAEYVVLFNTDLNNAVGVTYSKSTGEVVAQVAPSIQDDPLIDFSNQVSLEGVYETNLAEELSDGSFVNTLTRYHLRPDGTGQVEFDIIDPVTGNLDFIAKSGRGICWDFQPPNNFIWYRTFSGDDRGLPGNNVPSLSTCGLLLSPDNTLIDFQRDQSLLNVNPAGKLQTYAINRSNQATLPGGADSTVIELTDTFIRTFEPVIPFIGSPPLTADDNFTVSAGILSSNDVTVNDVDDDMDLLPGSVSIVSGPKNGIGSIDGTGNIEYTPNAGFSGTDQIQYRVFDNNGNESTIGTVFYTVL